jgi:hypothetical protein
VSDELHPETSPEGILLSERFNGRDWASFYKQLRARGGELSIVFNNCS